MVLVKLLSHYYRSRLRGSYRATQLIDKVYPLNDVDVETPYGKVNVDLTLASGQAIATFEDTPEGRIIAKHAAGVCYDIGAHFGIYSVLMAKHHSVYSFEPNPVVFRHLQKTASGRNITPFNIALSDFNGEADFFVPEEATMASLNDWTHDDDMRGITQYAGEVRKTSCEVRTLDDFVRENNLPLPNFMKIDVEGAELSIFRGGKKTIASSRPKIYFEVSTTLWAKMGTSHEEGFEFFDSLGYRLYKDELQLSDLDMEWDNVLAIP